MFRTMIGTLTVLVVSLGLIGTTGCGMKHEVKADDQQFQEAMDKIDRMTKAVDKAVGDITKESESWRKALPELEAKLKADGQDVLANEVRNLLASVSADLNDALKASADYIEVKLKDNLKAFRKALDAARTKILTAREKKNTSGIKEALDELANVKVFHDPVVTAFIPAHIELRWKDHAQTAYDIRVPLVEVRGWGFERPAPEAPRFGISVVTHDGKERPLPLGAVFSTTRYLMQMKLDSPGIQFGKEDHKLVFKLGATSADRRELPISHVVPKPPPPPSPPPPPPETITGVVVTIQTTDDNKEDRGQVVLKLLDELTDKVHEKGPVGAGVNWERNHTRTPYRSGGIKRRSAARFLGEAARPFADEEEDESRDIAPAALTRPIPVIEGRKVRLQVELQTTQAGRQVSWDASFKVVLYTSKGRQLEKQSPSHNFDTANDSRFYNFDIALPKPQP